MKRSRALQRQCSPTSSTLRAALTALSTSSFCASATSISFLPVLGSSVPKILPDSASTNSPSIRSCAVREAFSFYFDPSSRHSTNSPLLALGLTLDRTSFSSALRSVSVSTAAAFAEPASARAEMLRRRTDFGKECRHVAARPDLNVRRAGCCLAGRQTWPVFDIELLQRTSSQVNRPHFILTATAQG